MSILILRNSRVMLLIVVLHLQRERPEQTVAATATGTLLFVSSPPLHGTLSVENMFTQRAHDEVLFDHQRTQITILEHGAFAQVPRVELTQLDECHQINERLSGVLFAATTQGNMALVLVTIVASHRTVGVIKLEHFNTIHR